LKPVILDLFCCAGGAGMGYSLAGFDVVGVDISPQPHYPFEFHQSDAIEFASKYASQFDAIHASPPCQSFSKYKNVHKNLPERYPNLIPQTREELTKSRKPYIIENVPGAPLTNYIVLCGSSFGLPIRRHRLFETSFFVWGMACAHHWQKPQYPSSTGRRPMSRKTMEIGSWDIPVKQQREGMGIDWMSLEELAEAIPPAYTQYIGTQLLQSLVPNKRVQPTA